MLLTAFYFSYNKKYFDSGLPALNVYWASSIRFPDGHSANALFVPNEMSKDGRPFIVIREELQGLEPLPRQCILHEMVHVKVGGEHGHSKAFIDEFQRVLNLDGWEVMGCTDSGKS